MMTKKEYNMPLIEAIRGFTLAQLVKMFGGTHPAFLAGIVRAKVRYSARNVA